MFNFLFNSLKQHDVPPGKHAIISVRQPKGDLLWIQTPASTAANKKKTDKEKFKPKLTTWDDCDIIQVCHIVIVK